MLTLKQRQERAARRAARIAAKHEAIRQAALDKGEAQSEGSTVMKTNLATKKAVRIKSARRLGIGAGRKAAPPAAAGDPTNPLEAHYRAEKDAAKTEKAAKVAAWRKEVAEKVAKPDPALDAAVKAAEEGRRAKKAKAARPKGERKPGILTVAADILQKAGRPMSSQEIVDKALADGLWQTKGKTPAATLYAAIIREIGSKGREARFHKVERGKFAAVMK